MPSFGDKLKLEREKRKITLEQISSSTKIGTRMLQALEEEKFSQLPGGIFNKGFVRAYARVIGLDEDQAVADYLQASGEAVPIRPELAPRENASREAEENRIIRLEAISDSPSRTIPWGVFAVILLVIALTLSLWSHRRREQERLAAQTPPAKTALQSSTMPSPQEGSTSSPGASATTSDSAIQPSPASTPLTGAPNPALVPASASSEKASPSSAMSSAQDSQSGSAAAGALSPGDFMVVIHVREQSWVAVTVDGKSTPSELIEAGSTRSLRVHKLAVVKTGNAGGIDISLNGKKLDIGGGVGEVKTVTIGPAGLSPNASSP